MSLATHRVQDSSSTYGSTVENGKTSFEVFMQSSVKCLALLGSLSETANATFSALIDDTKLIQERIDNCQVRVKNIRESKNTSKKNSNLEDSTWKNRVEVVETPHVVTSEALMQIYSSDKMHSLPALHRMDAYMKYFPEKSVANITSMKELYSDHTFFFKEWEARENQQQVRTHKTAKDKPSRKSDNLFSGSQGESDLHIISNDIIILLDISYLIAIDYLSC